MDARYFDTLVRSLCEAGTRRGLLGLLATLPVVGGCLALFGGAEAEAKKKRRKNKKKTCKSQAQVCAGTCGIVTYKCKNKKGKGRKAKNKRKQADCGPCTCDPTCSECRICNEETFTCVADSTQAGNPCGDPGQVCQENGDCACETTSCPPCQRCEDGECVPDPALQGEVCGGNGVTTAICCDGVCCDGCCGEGGSCGACLVFVTSTEQTGDLDGLSGADTLCQTLADAPGIGLPGTYLAWLSTGTGANESPANGRFRQSGQPYTLIDGTVVADDWADLIDDELAAPINLTETGVRLEDPSILVWTHTQTDGTAGGTSNTSCEGWTTAAEDPTGDGGDAALTLISWTRGSLSRCNAVGRLYCFQQT